MVSLFRLPLSLSFMDLLRLSWPLILTVLFYRIRTGAKDTFLRELKELETRRAETRDAVQREELANNRRRRDEVHSWLKAVDRFIQQEVKAFQNSWAYGLPLLSDVACWWADLVNHVRQLQTRGSGINPPLVGAFPLALPFPDPKSSESFVGGEETLAAIRRHLEDDQVGIIGIHGMAGIGKTTYLQVIAHEQWRKLEEQREKDDKDDTTSNTAAAGYCWGRTFRAKKAVTFATKLWKAAAFSASRGNAGEADHDGLRQAPHERQGGADVVIWADAASEAENPIINIQRSIGDQLGLSLPPVVDANSDPSAACAILQTVLQEKRFVLFLDGVQGRLSWNKIGIPPPQSGSKCKIVFTTRSWETCNALSDESVKVNLLDEDESWALFLRTAGGKSIRSDSSIQVVARHMVAKCGGLPHALETVAEAMRSCTSPDVWEEALAWWDAPVTSITPGMEDVSRTLKRSFQKMATYLKDLERLERCLLYCSLFPDDGAVDETRLVDYWIGEGFVDAVNWNGVRRRGNLVISKLRSDWEIMKKPGYDEFGDVRLHGVLHRAIMWMTGGEKNESHIHLSSSAMPTLSAGGGNPLMAWKDAHRISYIGSSENLSPADHGEMPECPQLLTLLLNAHGRTLQVDRSRLRRIRVPANFFQGISKLRVLDLSGVDIDPIPTGFDSLVQLSYLNLSYTNIRELPGGLENLQKLRLLYLRGTSSLSQVSRGSICKYSLQALDLFRSGVNSSRLELSCLEEFKNLSELGLSLTSSYYLERLLIEFYDRTVFLQLCNVEGLLPSHLSQVFDLMKNLRELSVETRVGEVKCNCMKRGELPNLEILSLTNVVIKDLEGESTPGALLQSLRHLHIVYHDPGELSWLRRLAAGRVMISPTGPGTEETTRPMRLESFIAKVLPTQEQEASPSDPVPDHVSLDMSRTGPC